MGQTNTTKIIAIGVSCTVAVLLLSLAAWMILGGDAAANQSEGIQIIGHENASESGSEEAPESNNDPVAANNEPAPVDDPVPDRIAVYVTGEVVSPGVYTVSSGDRLDRVLHLAGGPTGQADLDRINLAAYVVDAAHYNIPAVGEQREDAALSGDKVAPASAAEPPANDCQTPVNINIATAQCLETLPGIGGVRAQSIVAHRQQAGPFPSSQAITDVSGIGDGIYRRIAEIITVDPG